MKYFPLVWHGLWRKPGRTWLAFVQIAVAFVLFGVLQGFDASVQRMIAETDADVNTSPGAVEALLKSRTGAIVGVTFMQRYGWKLGQRIPLQLDVERMDGSKDWAFDIVGVVETKDPTIRAERSDFMIVNYDYLDEARFDRKGRVTQFFVKVNDPKQAARWPTRTH